MLPKKLVPNISLAVQSMYLYTPCSLVICTHRGRTKILYNNFLSLYDPIQYMPVALRPLCEFGAYNVLLKCDVTGANVFPRYGRDIIGTWTVPQERAL
jgi:hypothetical protein